MIINSSMMAAYDNFLEKMYLDREEENERLIELEEDNWVENKSLSELTEEMTRHWLDPEFFDEERMFEVANEIKRRHKWDW